MSLDAFLSREDQATLRALLDTLVPPDDAPGAWDAGVGEYLARQFAGDLSHELGMYQAALALLDVEARLAFHQRFCEAGPEQRTALIAALERGDARATWPFRAESFVSRAVEHAHEGYYADPGNGGNAGAVTWGMIGFEVRG